MDHRCADSQRQTWTNAQSGDFAFVAFHPTDAAKAIAGGRTDGTAYYSTDGGSTWTAATHAGSWSGRIELCYAAKDPTRVYASVNVNGGEIWQSSDGGQTFQQKNSVGPDGSAANYLGNQGWYGNAIWAGDPTNADLVIVGGVNLWRSTDAGATLIDISTWYDPRSCHADHHRIVSDPKYDGTANRRLYFGNDGGIYTTADATTVGNDPAVPRINGWVRLDNSFGVTQFYGGAGNATSGTIVGGAQDNGTLAFTPANGPQKWGQMFGGDGGYCAADQSDSTVFYGEYVYLAIARSTDGGSSADYINGQYWDAATQKWLFKAAPYQIPDSASQAALFIAPFVIDPQTPTRILAGGQSLWRTNDAKTANSTTSGPSWASIKGSVGTNNISAIAIAPGNSDIAWVGYDNGAVFVTTSATAATPTWQQAGQGGSNPLNVSRYCTRICIDPANSNTVYVAFGGYVTGNVWKTTDGGQNWSNIGGSLPAAPIRGLAVHPARASFVYLGSEVGVYASEDGGATWSATNEGPTNCAVDDFFWMGKVLVAVTHGRGMFTIDLSSSGAQSPVVNAISPAGGPATGGTSVTVTGTGFTGVTSVGFGGTAANPQTGATDTQLVVVSPGGTGTVDITVTTPSGTSATSSADQFTYASAALTVTGINPKTGPPTGGTSVTVTGTGFTGATSVGFGGTSANPQSGVTDTQLVVVSPGGTGTVDVTVTTPAGTSPANANDQFTYADSKPTVTAVSPTSGPATGGTSVTVTGTGFTGVSSVGFGSSNVNVQSGATDTQLVAVSPGGTGTIDITVTTASGTSATSTSDQFTYSGAAPAVTGISPTSGPAAGGTSVTVTGTGFTGVTSVGFGSAGVNVQTGATDTQLTVVSPGGQGTVDITVTTPSGTSAVNTNDQFTYTAGAPVVTAVNPTSGPAVGGTQVTVAGTGFTGVTSVGFGNTGVNVQSGNTDTQLVVVSPGGSGTVDITVTTPSGTSATGAADQFTYVAATPTVTGISPTSGPATGATSVTVTPLYPASVRPPALRREARR